MKAGTTSLFNYIACHPCFRPPVAKEIDYFSFASHKSPDWYKAHFPRAAAGSVGEFTGEASTGYLPNPRAARRAYALFPDMRIIVILRDPVDRAVSHYFHEVRCGREPRSFSQAIRAPEADSGYLLDKEDEYPFHCGLLHGPFARRAHAEIAARKPLNRAYVFYSRYFRQLESWLTCFEPDRVLTVYSEDLFTHPQRVIDEVFDFLEISGAPTISERRVFNEGKRGEIDLVDRRFLENALEETLRRFADLKRERPSRN